jgi:hypothetical protein
VTRPAGLHRRSLATGALLGVALLGCSPPQVSVSGSSPTAHPSRPGEPRGLDRGWSLHEDSPAGFAVAFSDSWLKAQSDSPSLGPDLVAIAQRTPQLGSYFRDSVNASGGTGLALLAADPASLTLGYVTNLSVFRTDAGPVGAAPDLDAAVAGKLRVLRADTTLSGAINQRRMRLAGIDAARLAYGFKAGTRIVGVVAYLLLVDAGKERFEYELSLAGAIPDYAQLSDKVAASFKLLPAPFQSPRPKPSPSR